MSSQGRARTALLSLAALSAAVLVWSVAHWLTTQVAEPHLHLHEHGLAHGHEALIDAQRRLDHVHAYLAPTTLGAGFALIASLLGLRALPSASAGRGRASRAVVLSCALASSAVFAVVETVEHALVVGTGPPVALLTVGAVVHALVAAAAQVLASSLLRRLTRRQSCALVLVRERRVLSLASPEAGFSRMWIGRLAGRAPPAGAVRLVLP